MKISNFEYLRFTMGECPLCGNSHFTHLLSNDRYFMGILTVGCNVCGLVQTNPRPSEDGINLFYQRDYRRFYQGVSDPDEKYIYEMNKKERLRDVSKYLKNTAPINLNIDILDIGCSEGAFFIELREAGFTGVFYGIEPNPKFREYASRLSYVKTLSELSHMRDKVDLVVLNHVFEHFLNPDKYLKLIRDVMNESAILYIDVPDADEYSSIDDIHLAHVFHFTVRTLSLLVEKSGFSVISCEKYSPVSHPKSIRLLAKKVELIYTKDNIYSIDKEKKAWHKIKSISIFKKRIRKFIRKIPFAREIYYVIKFKK